MASLFDSGRIVDFILVLMLVEAALFCILARSWGDRVPLKGLLLNLAAGAFLLLALRAVLVGSGWMVAGAWLALALAAHLSDLVHRLRRP